MALGKIKGTGYGVDATYWRLVQSNIDWVSKTLYISLAGYVSGEARAAGASPITQDMILLSGEDFPLVNQEEGDIRSIIYSNIKESKLDAQGNETNEWATAQNV